MNTLLRVLVIMIALLGAAALAFATMNFSKRQILLGRNDSLTEGFKALAKTLEAQDAKDDGNAPTLTKDTSDVTDAVLDNPNKEVVFEGYPVWLEEQNRQTLKFDTEEKEIQLNSYYAYDEDGKIKIGPNGQKVTKGAGTMQELLDQAVDRAKLQQGTLNKTRAELSKMRDRVETNVKELNDLKGASRIVKKDLTTAKGEIVQLEGEKATLERNVAKLTSDKKELEAQVADAQEEIEKYQEREVGLTEDVARLKSENEELRRKRGPDGPIRIEGLALTTGDKGKIIESNDEFKFVIIEFSPDAMMEILGAEREKPFPQVDMSVRRVGRASAAGEFVTTVKLRHSVKDKNLVVADILTDWQQSPVEKGDVVFF